MDPKQTFGMPETDENSYRGNYQVSQLRNPWWDLPGHLLISEKVLTRPLNQLYLKRSSTCSLLSNFEVLQRSSKPWWARRHRPIIPASVPWVGPIALWERCILSQWAARATKARMTRIRWKTPKPVRSYWEGEMKKRIHSLISNNQLNPEGKASTDAGHQYLFVIPLSRRLYSKNPWRKARCRHVSMTVRRITSRHTKGMWCCTRIPTRYVVKIPAAHFHVCYTLR